MHIYYNNKTLFPYQDMNKYAIINQSISNIAKTNHISCKHSSNQVAKKPYIQVYWSTRCISRGKNFLSKYIAWANTLQISRPQILSTVGTSIITKLAITKIFFSRYTLFLKCGKSKANRLIGRSTTGCGKTVTMIKL